ncbi:MAG TPA: hypothetical protein VIQ29_24465 [Ancylobacter sp.]
MVFSVQQIKFEFLMYIKEFGGKAGEWRIGIATDAAAALFNDNAVDAERDIWLWKPALTPAAARSVYHYMTQQFHVPPVGEEGEGTCVFLFKKTA